VESAIDFYQSFGEPEVAEALRAERRQRINRARGVYAKPYDEADAKAMACATTTQDPDRVRARKLKGLVKWINGRPTLHYVKSGFTWVSGDYVKLVPRATGITQTFGTSRAQERADRHAADHPGKGRPKRDGLRPRSARAKSKALAREQFERVKPINAARLGALKADRQAARLARERQAARY
jgi:hypothetical protein